MQDRIVENETIDLDTEVVAPLHLRAQRRHDQDRVKANRARHLLVTSATDTSATETNRPVSARVLGMHANTAALCSCSKCGNPRKFTGALTIQEQRAVQRERITAVTD
jgi:hypothetical protein